MDESKDIAPVDPGDARMHRRLALAGTALVSLVATGLTTLGLAPASPASAASPADVRFGTFNIVTVSADGHASGERKVWRERRGTVISQILRQGLDVVGVQEANQSSIYGSRLVDDKRNQYLDLRNGLNRAGGAYQVSSVYPYNCVKAWTSRSCHYRNRAASGDNRILYSTRTMLLLHKGAYKYPHQVRNSTARYLGWAVFRVRSTGHEVLFVTTHLDPYSKSVRVAQWHDLIRKVNALRHGRPVVVTGDFNSTKYSDWAGTMLPATVKAGYGDALGQHSHTNPSSLRPQTTTNVWINSFNKWRRDVRSYSYEQDRFSSRPRTGNGVDWIFASNNLTVRNFEVVADMDRNLQVQGTIPSDHQMLAATVAIP
jgi:endonuclease/exonuclease/phosphatase family metal-dependent hydrolase